LVFFIKTLRKKIKYIKKMKDRIFAVDATKAFAIFCIVVAHNDYG
jgi:hypothetical protein